MPRRCAIGCTPTRGVLHTFPNPSRFPEQFKAWVNVISGKDECDIDYKKMRVCDRHFTERDRNRNNRLNALAVPSLFLLDITANVQTLSELESTVCEQLRGHSEVLDNHPVVSDSPPPEVDPEEQGKPAVPIPTVAIPTEVKEELQTEELDLPPDIVKLETEVDIKTEDDELPVETEACEENGDDDIGDKRGTERRASTAFSEKDDEVFKGFDDIKEIKTEDYCRVLERLETEVTAAAKSFVPLRIVMATLPAPARASTRPRKDTEGSRPSSALSSRSDSDGAMDIEEQTNGEMKINSVVEDSGMPIISKVAKSGVNMEYVWPYDEDDIKLEENDAYVRERTELATHGRDVQDTTTIPELQVTVKCEQTECSSDIEEQTNRERKINSVVDEGSALVFSEIESCDIKIESVWSYDKDNLDECDAYVRERTELATLGRDVKDTTTSEDYESKQVAAKFDNCERIAHCDQTEDRSSVTSPPSDVCDEHLERTLNSVKSSSPNNVQLYICDTCNKCFKTKVGIIKHIRVHSGDMPSKGDVSTKRLNSTKHKKLSSTKLNRKHYTSLHTVDKYKCDVCMKCFNRKAHFIEHSRRHTGVKPFKCDVCMKCFNYKRSFIAHCRIHTGEKQYKCDECMKCFAYKSDLTRHYRVHTGEKPYKCDVCFKGFTYKGALTEHNRIHTGEKPYKCDVCIKCFASRSNLTKHIRLHTGQN